MEHEDSALPINSNLKCHVCGENQFEEREGFYYCQECGTKQEQVRLVEVDQDDEYDQEKLKSKKLKISVAKSENPQLTSWECYNYILRGFVEELLSFGAKEELKLMTLQVWAAYLRRMEVAFFNRKQADLPRLGIRYFKNDAETIYNHRQARKKRRRRSEDTSCTSGGESRSARRWNRSKRKLDESNYSLTSATTATSATSGGSGFTSSTSANSNKAIKIGFNIKAKTYLKRKMPKKHIEKHAADAEGLLKCHKQPKAREINRTDYNLMVVSTKHIYSVLAIALNLIEDEIQLSDLVRFIHEGHIGTSNVLQYFPENIANKGKEMLKKINFYKCPEKYSDKALREHVSIICKNLCIRMPKKPDIVKLVRRYATELCLPTDVADYIERLINLLPPQFGVRAMGYYPGFEARAMAYIIFTLKLIFGLDGSREHRISHCAQKLNNKIKELNREKYEKEPLIFVWNEWVEYIEMRKIVVSQLNSSFSEQFKQCQSTEQMLEQMAEEMRKTEDRDNLLNDSTNNIQAREKLSNFRSLFERFQETYKLAEDKKNPVQIIDFKPSFTPALSYMKNIMLVCDSGSNSVNLKIPDFMRIDHSQRNVNAFLQVKPLIDYFKRHQLKLNVYSVAANKNQNLVGIFRAPRTVIRNAMKVQKACFEVTEEEWAANIMNDVAIHTDDLGFKSDLTPFPQRYYDSRKIVTKKHECFNKYMDYDLTKIHDDSKEKGSDSENEQRTPQKESAQQASNLSGKTHNDDLHSIHSFELFSENNMEPLDNETITKPRRNLENIDLFEGISDEESLINEDDGDLDAENPTDNLSTSGNDLLSSSQEFQTLQSSFSRPSTPPISEEFIKVEPDSPHHSGINMPQDKANSGKKKDHTTEANDLKFYISNMDCWMMLGNLAMLAKAQRSQLQDKFPRSFNWLLETCAQTISVDWSAVYEQLLCIEVMFCMCIKDPENIKNCVYIKPDSAYKEMQTIMNSYNELW